MNVNSKVNDKLKLIVSSLSPLITDTNFYMNHAPKGAVTPYIVFRLEDLLDTSPSYNATIKFMCWDDRNQPSSRNNRNADLILKSMNKAQFSYEDLAIHSVLSLQQTIPSEYLTDKQCIELQFDARIYI